MTSVQLSPQSSPSRLSIRTAELEASNDARIREINARGKTVGGIETHAIEIMLGFLLTPEQLDQARYQQQAWLAAQLDEIESNLRKRVFTDLSTPGAQR